MKYSDDFAQEVQRIAQALCYEQDVSSENPNMIAAAKLYLKYAEDDLPPTERNLKIPIE